MADGVKKTDAEWKETLTPEQYHTARNGGTERPSPGRIGTPKRRGSTGVSAAAPTWAMSFPMGLSPRASATA